MILRPNETSFAGNEQFRLASLVSTVARAAI